MYFSIRSKSTYCIQLPFLKCVVNIDIISSSISIIGLPVAGCRGANLPMDIATEPQRPSQKN